MRQLNRACQAGALACMAISLPLHTSVASAQTASGLALVTSHLTEGIVHYRLIPLAHAKASSTTSWITERRFTEYRGRPAVMQVMTIGGAGHVHIDSLLFDRATLRPVWEHLHGGGMATLLAFDGTHVTGRMTQPDSASRPIKLTTATPSFSSTTDDVVAQSVPLVSGYHVVLSLVGGDGSMQSETIRVRRRERVSVSNVTRNAWVVDLSYPSGSEVLWIDPTTRAIVRHIYTLNDHSQLEVLTS